MTSGSFIPKCNLMNPLRPFIPCESVCHEYAKACGKPRELVCAVFGDPDDPDPHNSDAGPIKMCKGVAAGCQPRSNPALHRFSNAECRPLLTGSSSFPRFLHREWLALMPGVDPGSVSMPLTRIMRISGLSMSPCNSEQGAGICETRGPC